jgi:light-independent protochlorophyllide reductase subunit B
VERAPKTPPLASAPVPPPIQIQGSDAVRTAPWAPDAEKELKKIPFFVRGKARANTERFARERQLPLITLETLYDAKAHFGR